MPVVTFCSCRHGPRVRRDGGLRHKPTFNGLAFRRWFQLTPGQLSSPMHILVST